jgi:hypothetical protein
MRYLRALILLLGLAVTVGAQAELRTYEVDAKYRQEVFAALKAVLNPGEQHAAGRISMLPTGQLLIDTSAEMHEQVAAVLESIRNHRVEATPRVTLRYWAVLGTADSSQSSGAGQGTEVPEILSGVLDELRRVHGGLSFRLYGNATLVSESGQRSQIRGETLNITQLAYVLQSTLNAELTINFRYSIRPSGRGSAAAFAPNNIIQSFQHEVNLQTSLEPNEFVVVGENAIRNSAQLTDGIDGTVFYIVQWPVAE